MDSRIPFQPDNVLAFFSPIGSHCDIDCLFSSAMGIAKYFIGRSAIGQVKINYELGDIDSILCSSEKENFTLEKINYEPRGSVKRHGVKCGHGKRDTTCNIFNCREWEYKSIISIITNHAFYYSIIFFWYLKYEFVVLHIKTELGSNMFGQLLISLEMKYVSIIFGFY
jgi:hypothetical protein